MNSPFVTDYGVVMSVRHESDCEVMDDATGVAISTAEQFLLDINAAAEKRGLKIETRMDHMYTVPRGKKT